MSNDHEPMPQQDTAAEMQAAADERQYLSIAADEDGGEQHDDAPSLTERDVLEREIVHPIWLAGAVAGAHEVLRAIEEERDPRGPDALWQHDPIRDDIAAMLEQWADARAKRTNARRKLDMSAWT